MYICGDRGIRISEKSPAAGNTTFLMRNTSVLTRQAISIVLLLLLIFPFIQARFGVVEIKPLKGAITEPLKATFDVKEWFSGNYQHQMEKNLNETFSFRNWLIHLYNQISFSLFNEARANGVIVGKDNYLFEESYIKAYYGTDFIGMDTIDYRMERLKYIQDTLAKLNKNLVLVFAAGKGSYYPEYIPEKYHTEKQVTNYEAHVELAREKGVEYIDFNRYFLDNKNKSPYPLYPQYGIHWSYYGMCVVADSLINYMERVRKIDMPDIHWSQVDTLQPNTFDYDIADGMNILTRLESFNMGYPALQFEAPENKTKPSVLVISDSYYWGMYNFGIANTFGENHFWYYNKKIYPESFDKILETSQVNLKKELEKHDVIILMATEATLPKLGWGFIERAYAHFAGKNTEGLSDIKFQRKLRNLVQVIKTDRKWMKTIEEKAAKRNISVDSMIIVDATWMIKQERN